MSLIQDIKENAKRYNKRIVLAEGEEERTIQAADIVIAQNLASIVLLGNPDVIKAKAEKIPIAAK